MPTFERVLAAIGAVAGIGAFVFAIAQGYLWYMWRRQITWDDALRVAETLLKQIEGGTWRPEVVLGVGRSGGIWGGWIAGNLGSLPFAVVDAKYVGTKTLDDVEFPRAEGVLSGIRKAYGDELRVLVIEGATSTGLTLREFLKHFKAELGGWDIKTAVLYRNTAAQVRVDFVGKDLIPWPTDDKPFPWHFRAGYRPFLGSLVSRG